MVKIKINFTKKQFRELLDLIYAADWLINAIKDNDEEEKYQDLIQYIYSFANKMDCEDLVEYEKEYKKYYGTRELEDGPIREFIDEYDEYIFWDELSSRLADRDIKNNISEDKDLGHEELVMKIWDREDKYNSEFIEKGLDNVKVEGL